MKGTFIIVQDRGFVTIGKLQPHPDLAFHWLVSPSRTIRRWGTTEGLAQLIGGPRADTKLDAICEETVPWRAVIKLIRADEETWEVHLSATRDASGGGNQTRSR